ncbi:hypothetical protein pdam_00002633 [Pocillopora damicornis]|uniref:Uncharacterized protein n=1 Tax=Pocillopora damicornis TaxID=46731 RepID=A0A3M6U352_POCDA|nr:hypothetical protein pdam_00002633 [Pocillopora damicornis]
MSQKSGCEEGLCDETLQELKSANKINIQLAVKKERLRKGLADAFTIQKIEHKDVVKLFKTQLINLKRFAKFTDVKLLIT